MDSTRGARDGMGALRRLAGRTGLRRPSGGLAPGGLVRGITARRSAGRLALVCAALVGLASGVAAPVAAQTVTGTVLDVDTSEPLAGVLVSLLDPSDERAAATLTDEAGRFTLEPGRFGRFRLRAERIGLQTTTSASFDLFSTNPREERVLVGQRPIEIDGLIVDSRVEQCRIDEANAVRIQRWWQEVRTALDVSSVVQSQGLAHFEVERYERAWTRDLSRVVEEGRYTEVGLSSRPFVSVEAEVLAEEGFVRRGIGGSRDYYAPDADVLLSDAFLGRHCFSLTEHDDERVLGLSFEPTSDETIDIVGTLWVDTTTAELQSLDFRYVREEGVPENESGGRVSFEYLSTGAWIVHEWYIRMPSLSRDRRGDIVLVGYVDVGGKATPLVERQASEGDPDAVGAVRGVVRDSVGGRVLEGATVRVLGTDLEAVTDGAGEFVLPSVPVGGHRISFTHAEVEAWGLGPTLAEVEVEERLTTEVRLSVPGFRSVASVVCQGSGLRARAVLVGDVVGADGAGLPDVTLVLTWPAEDDDDAPVREEVRADASGHYATCTIPPDTPLQVDLRIDGSLIRGFSIMVPLERIEYRRVQVPLRD